MLIARLKSQTVNDRQCSRELAGVFLLSVLLLLLCSELFAAAPIIDVSKLTSRQRQFYLNVDLSHWNTDEGLERLIGQFPTHAGNAAEHYAKLETLYPQEKDEERSNIRAGAYAGVMEIIRGAMLRDCALTPDYYPVMDQGDRRQPDILVYEAYLQALLRYAAELEKEGRIQDAAAAYRAGLVWGWHLTSDRSSLTGFMLGLSIKGKVATNYANFLERNGSRKDTEAVEFAEKISAWRVKTFAKSRAQMGEFAGLNSLYACSRVALGDVEPFWRQEAVLRLGVMRHGRLDPGKRQVIPDEEATRVATGTLQEVIRTDPVEHIRRLAEWSMEHVNYEIYISLRTAASLRSVAPEAEQ